MIEQDFDYADSTVKKMTGFSETRIEDLELKGEKTFFCCCQETQGQEIHREKETRLQLQCCRIQ